jgi:hypothetical protein
MFAANRSIVVSPQESFESNDPNIIYLVNNIFITETSESISKNIIKNYEFEKIIILTQKDPSIKLHPKLSETMLINGDDPTHFVTNTITCFPYNSEKPQYRYYTIQHGPLTEKEYIYISIELYNSIKDRIPMGKNITQSNKATVIVCDSFKKILPALLYYCYIYRYHHHNLKPAITLRSLFKKNELTEYKTFVDQISSKEKLFLDEWSNRLLYF